MTHLRFQPHLPMTREWVKWESNYKLNQRDHFNGDTMHPIICADAIICQKTFCSWQVLMYMPAYCFQQFPVFVEICRTPECFVHNAILCHWYGNIALGRKIIEFVSYFAYLWWQMFFWHLVMELQTAIMLVNEGTKIMFLLTRNKYIIHSSWW